MRKLLIFAVLGASLLLADDRSRIKFDIKNKEGKPVDRAAVIVKFLEGRSIVKLGKKNAMQWELRTNQMGQVSMPSIPQGKVRVQVIAKGYQTFGDVFEVNQEEQTIPIVLNPPQQQYSAH